MKIITFDDPKRFLERVQPFLEADEALNSLILGVNMRLVKHPDWTEVPPYQAAVEGEDGALHLVASITPPNNLLVAGAPDVPEEALDVLALNLLEGGWDFPGVNGEKVLAGRAAAAWSRLTGQNYRVKMRLRAYELRQVIPPPAPPPGYLRHARMDELDLMAQWRNAFTVESLHAEPDPNSHEKVKRVIEAGSLYLWDDNGPASIAASTRSTPRGISIGAVYTPPEKRGHGYASACVAALSQRMLDEGKEFCALFTDLDYPTSNSIYQKIGYQMVGDFQEYRFDKSA